MINLNAFKEYNIPYSWITLYVGRKLGIFTVQDIMHYAEEYLLNHSDCTDPYIAECAAGISENDSVDDLLINVFKNLKLQIPEKDDAVWNLEKRKLRYCILKPLEKKILDDYILIKHIRVVYEDFDYPEDIRKFIYPEDIKKYEELSAEDYFALLRKEFGQFLSEEKRLIDARDTSWSF